ncbi:carbohydrate-binding module family 32 protein [Melanomma pulvis-pyrius CBS 109.77]|uniref:alpha,alpha-trehalase n=1 Tax=Melanomma pulvis-pyrius CBS 109.77 TaxID=1314802 RepID=A0A6A6XMN4_9PLEO|nr:carbohydrate-binding module family 32 protein [Melanomma pulvis-pyrius CBS 109.77]
MMQFHALLQRALIPLLATVLTRTSLVSAVNAETRYHRVLWDDDNWIITTQDLNPGNYQSRMSLANGYLGINVAAVGPFFEIDTPVNDETVVNGWPLFDRRQTFATIAGFYNDQGPTPGDNYPWLYQYGGESIISGVPHWSGLVVEAHGAILNASVNPDHLTGFTSTLDARAGVLSWRYSWKPGGTHAAINVHYSMFVHKLHVNQAAVQLKLTATRDTNVTVYDILEGDCAVRTDFVDRKYENDSPTIWTAVRPGNVPATTAYLYSTLGGNKCVDWSSRTEVTGGIFSSNFSSIAQSVNLKLVAGETGEIGKYIGAASSDAFSEPKNTASIASITGASEGFATLLHTHIEEWTSILPRHSVDRYAFPNGSLPEDLNVQELHIAAVTTPFHILQNTVGPNAVAAAGNNTHLNVHSIPVCGLGSDCYGGLIFWDAEVWMAPGLQVSHPQHVKQVINYRVEKYPQAQQNIKMAYSSSQNHTDQFSPGGAVYPWTSGRYGNCTGTGPCFDYEYHLNGDIGISFLNQLVVTGDEVEFKEKLLPIYNAIAHFYAELLTYNETSDTYNLRNATDPDEYANNVNNVGFTTALIQKHLDSTNMLNSWFGFSQNENWAEKASKLRLPINEEAGIILEYDNMKGYISVKQADIILIDDFLHYDNPYSLANLDYYAAKQSPNGPGMTYGVFSIVANEISPSGCSSYTYDLYSTQPYVRAPWFQLSEQLEDDPSTNGGTNPAFPFLTGMGGANRVAIFGYLGLRLFIDRLDIDPSLPPQIPYLDYRTFYWQGHGINATSNATHTTLARLPAESYMLPTANRTYMHSPIPVSLGARGGTYQLPVSPLEMLVVPNRPIGQTTTVKGNILQCAANVTSTTPYLPAQFPLSAIDGAASTRWQPVHSSTTIYLTVDLGATFPSYPIKQIIFDWAHAPPLSYSVFFSNVSLPPFGHNDWGLVTNVTRGDVELSRPYDPARAAIIEKYEGNQTNVTLESVVWSGRYATLGVNGCWGDEGGNRTHRGGPTVAEWSLIRDLGEGVLVAENATEVNVGEKINGDDDKEKAGLEEVEDMVGFKVEPQVGGDEDEDRRWKVQNLGLW